jgi:hypothetical protein
VRELKTAGISEISFFNAALQQKAIMVWGFRKILLVS